MRIVRWLLPALSLLCLAAASAWGNGFAAHGIPLPALLAALQSPDPAQRLEAASVLGLRREKAAVAPLLARLQDAAEEEAVLRAVIEALGSIRDLRALPPLRHFLKAAKSEGLRAAAAQALGRFQHPQALAGLLQAWRQEQHIRVQVAILGALGEFPDAAATAALLEALATRHHTLQLAAVQALGQPQRRQATLPLLARLRQARSRVLRREIVKTLGRIKDTRATDELIALWPAAQADPPLKQALIAALAEIGDRRAVPPLLAELAAGHPETLLPTVQALGKLGDQAATAPLVGLLEAALAATPTPPPALTPQRFAAYVHHFHVQRFVLEALANLEDAHSFDVVAQATRRCDLAPHSAMALRLRELCYQRRRAALVALARLPEARAGTLLIAHLHDPEASVRAEAARLLGQRRDPQAFSALVRALEDAAPDVRFEAAIALGALGDARAVPALLARLHDAHALVRERAVLALAALGDARALAPLQALQHREPEARVQRALAQALATLAKPP